MAEWFNSYPTKTNSIDLVGIELTLTSNPPEDTSFGGMKMVILAAKNDRKKRFKVMMTDQDLSKAVELYVYSGDACFTFQPSEKNPTKYAEVCKVGES